MEVHTIVLLNVETQVAVSLLDTLLTIDLTSEQLYMWMLRYIEKVVLSELV